MGCGRVALIDSGVAAEHPHLAGASLEGFSLCFGAKGVQRGTDFSDCTGHGTAIAAALYRSVPSATIVAVRVLDSELRTTTSALVAAIEAAVLEGCVVLNLSLGSQAEEARDKLEAAVATATEAGAICVAAAHPRGSVLWPADLPGVLSAQAHRSCPVGAYFHLPGDLPRFLCHGFPRPIEGRRPTDNFFGPSFAAIQLTARVLRLQAELPLIGFNDVVARLRLDSSGPWQDA